jgi:hypothetical protein
VMHIVVVQHLIIDRPLVEKIVRAGFRHNLLCVLTAGPIESPPGSP